MKSAEALLLVGQGLFDLAQMTVIQPNSNRFTDDRATTFRWWGDHGILSAWTGASP